MEDRKTSMSKLVLGKSSVNKAVSNYVKAYGVQNQLQEKLNLHWDFNKFR